MTKKRHVRLDDEREKPPGPTLKGTPLADMTREELLARWQGEGDPRAREAWSPWQLSRIDVENNRHEVRVNNVNGDIQTRMIHTPDTLSIPTIPGTEARAWAARIRAENNREYTAEEWEITHRTMLQQVAQARQAHEENIASSTGPNADDRRRRLYSFEHDEANNISWIVERTPGGWIREAVQEWNGLRGEFSPWHRP
jgi:hypothetical protein